MGRRCIGWSFRLRSLKIVVLGYHSRKASRRSAISRAKKYATRSSPMISRSDQGICHVFALEIGNKAMPSTGADLVIILLTKRIEWLYHKVGMMFFKSIIRQEKVLDGQSTRRQTDVFSKLTNKRAGTMKHTNMSRLLRMRWNGQPHLGTLRSIPTDGQVIRYLGSPS